MDDIRNIDDLTNWIATQPRQVAVTIVVRAVLRLLPCINAEAATTHDRQVLQTYFWICAVLFLILYDWDIDEPHSLLLQNRHYVLFPRMTALYSAVEVLQQPEKQEFYVRAAISKCFEGVEDEYLRSLYFQETIKDSDAIDLGPSSVESIGIASMMVEAGLWAEETPTEVQSRWTRLKSTLLSLGEHWEVWTDWYDARLAGRPMSFELFDAALAAISDEVWQLGPPAVNARIKELIAEHTPAEPIPAQGAGPHMRLADFGDDLKIELVPPSEIDAEGNDLGRIRSLLPQVRRASDRLASHLGSTNAYPELVEDLAEYRAALGTPGEPVAWGVLFGAGVMMENAAAAAKRKIDDRLWPPLEDTAQAALSSLLTLHGPLMLATAEGRALADDADRMQQTRSEQSRLRDDAAIIATRLRAAPEIIEQRAAQIVGQAAQVIGKGGHPERGTTWGVATIKHLATILIPAGVLGAGEAAIVHLAGGGEAAAGAGAAAVVAGHLMIGDRGRVRAAARALGDPVAALAQDQARLVQAQLVERARRLTPFRQFVVANEAPLRRIAENSTQLRWMLSYIDFIVRTNSRGG